jgi:hypothetical protein
MLSKLFFQEICIEFFYVFVGSRFDWIIKFTPKTKNKRVAGDPILRDGMSHVSLREHNLLQDSNSSIG